MKKFTKAEIYICNDLPAVVTASGGIASCTVPGKPVEECDFE